VPSGPDASAAAGPFAPRFRPHTPGHERERGGHRRPAGCRAVACGGQARLGRLTMRRVSDASGVPWQSCAAAARRRRTCSRCTAASPTGRCWRARSPTPAATRRASACSTC
jgi:hypothetical protein